jgi:hypothetical protein
VINDRRIPPYSKEAPGKLSHGHNEYQNGNWRANSANLKVLRPQVDHGLAEHVCIEREEPNLAMA